ncbi:hypothetical protein BV898_19395 [Hypsibius exemplaris]|uniref:Uncharacterized protein n=1 Tax=Hypsibius exemplaris TaxID=2072580 RepID=A0A9X6RPK0_HYPEX|nr:hypothetical protein BV898_19395 [Hypsibius exemplaris]
MANAAVDGAVGANFNGELGENDGFFKGLLQATKDLDGGSKKESLVTVLKYVKDHSASAISAFSIVKTAVIAKMSEEPAQAVVKNILQVAARNNKWAGVVVSPAPPTNARSPHAVILKPANGANGPLSSAEFKKKMAAAIPREQRIVGMTELKPTRSGGFVAVCSDAASCEQIMQQMDARKEDLGLEQVTKSTNFDRLPKIIIRQVPKEYSEDEFRTEFCHATGVEMSRVRVVKKLWNETNVDRLNCAFVVEVEQAVREQMISRGKMMIGYETCYVADHEYGQ